LAAFLGEQLARTGKLSVLVSSLLPVVLSIFAMFWFILAGRSRWVNEIQRKAKVIPERLRLLTKREGHSLFRDMTTGLRDFDFIADLVKYFFLSLAFLSAIFIIFTAFELWRFAGS